MDVEEAANPVNSRAKRLLPTASTCILGKEKDRGCRIYHSWPRITSPIIEEAEKPRETG
jgi:hypothetical protein